LEIVARRDWIEDAVCQGRGPLASYSPPTGLGNAQLYFRTRWLAQGSGKGKVGVTGAVVEGWEGC
jgi:hypothetical protein